MPHAGFVLVGGKSTRMGRDKALLPWKQGTLAQHVARIVERVANPVALIGDPGQYNSLGYAVYPDRWPGRGPIGGVATALAVSPTEWCVVVGCDMPGLTADALDRLLREAGRSGARCVVPAGPTGPEPLCGVYHRECLPVLEKAIAEGRLKMRDAVTDLAPLLIAGMDPGWFANLNTPEEFEAFADK